MEGFASAKDERTPISCSGFIPGTFSGIQHINKSFKTREAIYSLVQMPNPTLKINRRNKPITLLILPLPPILARAFLILKQIRRGNGLRFHFLRRRTMHEAALPADPPHIGKPRFGLIVGIHESENAKQTERYQQN